MKGINQGGTADFYVESVLGQGIFLPRRAFLFIPLLRTIGGKNNHGKVPDGQNSYMYALPGEDENGESEAIYVQDFLRGYISIDFSGNIVVIKTFPGHANTVCNAIDNLNMDEILGTVAGDNCMFACLREGVSGDVFMAKLKRLIPGIDD